jgi:hypothetical protein
MVYIYILAMVSIYIYIIYLYIYETYYGFSKATDITCGFFFHLVATPILIGDSSGVP